MLQSLQSCWRGDLAPGSTAAATTLKQPAPSAAKNQRPQKLLKLYTAARLSRLPPLAFHLRRFQGRMPLANWLDDFFKNFIHYVADSSFESFVFFDRRIFFDSQNGFIHLVVNIEEPLKNVFCYFWILEHSFLRETQVLTGKIVEQLLRRIMS